MGSLGLVTFAARIFRGLIAPAGDGAARAPVLGVLSPISSRLALACRTTSADTGGLHGGLVMKKRAWRALSGTPERDIALAKPTGWHVEDSVG
jgi:hypothetical protein